MLIEVQDNVGINQADSAEVGELKLDFENRTNSFVVGDQSELVATLCVTHRRIPDRENIVVSLGCLQPHLRQVFLKLSVHLHALLLLTVDELQEQLCFLGHV